LKLLQTIFVNICTIIGMLTIVAIAAGMVWLYNICVKDFQHIAERQTMNELRYRNLDDQVSNLTEGYRRLWKKVR
jgi:hypothetical protein